MNITASSASKQPTLPRHIAIIMDGNGRWARQRGLPRTSGHHAGVEAVRSTVETCAKRGIEVLTLFAFSSENWKRPAEEVMGLMSLFVQALEGETDKMHRNGIRVRFVGDRGALNPQLQERMRLSEQRTAANTGMTLVIAVAYGGRWDILQATQRLAAECVHGTRAAHALSEADLSEYLSLAGLPEPDLFIRTGGERRISNFLLWQLAYTELYFCDVLWPEFDPAQLELALNYFSERQRRFGLTGEQAAELNGASAAASGTN